MNALTQDVDNQAAEKELISVSTSRFGTIEVDPDKVITLTSPFLGFSESIRFILRPHAEDSPFMWLQSLDNPELAFVVISPTLLPEKYSPKITKQTTNELDIQSEQELDMLVLLTIPAGNPQEMTANLLGPLVINTTKRLAKQIVLDPKKYNPCLPLFQQ